MRLASYSLCLSLFLFLLMRWRLKELKNFAASLNKLCLLFICLLLVAATNGSAAEITEPIPPYLFLPAENTQDIEVQKGPFIVRSRLVSVDFELLSNLQENLAAEPDEEHQLILNVFEGLEYTLIIQKIERNRSGSYSWYGQLKDIPMGQVVLVVHEKRVFGNISKTNFSYQIRHISDETHAIYEIDPSKFPPTSEPIIPNLKSKASPSIDPLKNMMNQMESHISGKDTVVDPHISGSNARNGGDEFVSQNPFSSDPSSSSNSSSSIPPTQADNGSVVDVLVVYTAEARVAAGGTSAISSLIDLATSETNAAYSNSGVSHTIRIVGRQETSFSETGFTFSGFLTSAQDGSISGVHALRDSTGADLVVMLVDGDDSLCGLAYLMTPVSSSFAPYGYSVTQTNCATGNYTFGHEIGHNMSARHDRTADNTDGSPFNYNHGYLFTVNPNNYKTIMGTGGNTRIQYFSNPNVLFDGAATGVVEGDALAADNRLTFQNTSLTVSQFRQSIDASPSQALTVSGLSPNSERVVSPYWQSDSGSYTFVAVTHPSLSGMASQIGVIIEAIRNDGTLFGSSTSFTVDGSTTTRVFIVRSEHPSINSASIPSAQFITGTANFEHGHLGAVSVATSPTTSTGTGVGEGYQDATMLSFWGAVVVEQSNTGFAMEFIGDMHDSAAAPTFAGANPVSGPGAP
jgi:hypothetical protein